MSNERVVTSLDEQLIDFVIRCEAGEIFRMSPIMMWRYICQNSPIVLGDAKNTKFYIEMNGDQVLEIIATEWSEDNDELDHTFKN